MENIPLKCARARMILAEDIYRPNGAANLPIARKGSALTQGLIERLETLGVQSVAVEQDPVYEKEEGALQDARNELTYRFKPVEGNPRMMKIKAIYDKRLIDSEEGAHER